MNNNDQSLVFGGDFTTGEENTLATIEIEPKAKTQDRYVFRNLRSFIAKKARSFQYAAVKCFRTYTNFRAFIPNVKRKFHIFTRFWKENYKPLVLLSRLGEFWTDFTAWARRKHRFFDFYIWGSIFALFVLILYLNFDPSYIDEGGKLQTASFLSKQGTLFYIGLTVTSLGFIQSAYGFNNIYKWLINITRKYPITMGVVLLVVSVAIPLLCTIGKPDFWDAIMVPGIVSLVLYVFFYLDFNVGLISRFIFRKSDDGSNAIGSTVKGYLYLAPALIPLIVFTFYPMLNAIFMGFVKFDKNFLFTEWSLPAFFSKLFTDGSFRTNNVTLDWFQRTLTDPSFYHSLITTMIIVIVTVPLSTGIAVMLAVLMNSIKKLQGLFQTIYFLPYVTAMTAVTSVWRLILGDTGIINNILGINTSWLNSADPLFYIGSSSFIGIQNGSPFFRQSSWSYPFYAQLVAFIIYSVWNGLAFKIVIFLTGLQGIDKQVYQAAQLDGASRSRTFFKITLPLLAPIMLFITTTSMISAFKTYTSTKSLFLNNPRFNTIVFYMFFYIDGTKTGYDRASAVADLLFIIIMSFTGIRLMLKKRKAKKNAPIEAIKKTKGRVKVKRADRILQGGKTHS